MYGGKTGERKTHGKIKHWNIHHGPALKTRNEGKEMTEKGGFKVTSSSNFPYNS